ncbi:DUF4397 domain-containing protein [candidate division GN15 bacterium]|nr:DUF4397 domain-containing protein [candidate division GN15 bacterium]
MKGLKTLLTISLAIVAMALTAQAKPTASLQVIHNAADPALDVVDIYINDELALNDFSFRDATPFLEVPANTTLNIGLAFSDSESADDIVGTIPVNLKPRRSYVAIANGVLDPSSFAGNPDGRSIGFDLYTKKNIREEARWKRFVDVIVFHGSTDAPTVDVTTPGNYWHPLVDNLTYGEFSRYRTLRAKPYTLNITPGNDPQTVVASYEADLSGLKGGAAVVFASGFFDPPANGDGPGFGLFVALPDGTVLELPAANQTARLQVIHNSADAAAEVVDIYVNDEIFLPGFEFRTATPFVDVPAGVDLTIGVAGPGSGGPEDIIATLPPINLTPGETYVGIANGLLNPDDWAENPDGRSTAFQLFAADGIRESAVLPWFVRVVAFHGATDAPTVDIVPQTRWWRFPIVNNLSYGDFSNAIPLLPKKYILDVTPGDDNNTVVASFVADLKSLQGGAAIVFASGFLDPSANNEGPAFGLYVALPDGTVFPLPAYTGGYAKANEGSQSLVPNTFALDQNYPNPFNPSTTISFTLPERSNVTLDVYNMLGQKVETLVNGPKQAGRHEVDFDASSLASGVYFYRIESTAGSETKKMMLLK